MALETMTKLFSTTVGAGGSSSVTFSNIPQGYTDLKIVSSYRTNNAQTYDQLRLTFNGSSSALYSFRGMTAAGSSTPGSETSSSVTSIKVAPGQGNSATANIFSNDEIYISDYTSSKYKSLTSDAVSENNAIGSWISTFAGVWSNPSPITSITLTPESAGTFSQYSIFTLYGIKNTQKTTGNSMKALGGNSVKFDGTYWYHVFTSTGTFTPFTPTSAEALVVAGGGGGIAIGGGAGAGGLVYATIPLIPSTYTVTVGGGGAGTDYAVLNTAGSNSAFAAVTAFGGGAGRGPQGGTGNGGSGGGGGFNSQTPGGTALGGVVVSSVGTAYGNAGGTGEDTLRTTGGGGGAGAAGSNRSGSVSGSGGIGSSLFTQWGAATGTGQNSSGTYYYAGGGGGGGDSMTGVSAAGTGGLGGGGNGSHTGVAVSGTDGTGGGGGGGGRQSGTTYSGGNGGSGIVIIRYKG